MSEGPPPPALRRRVRQAWEVSRQVVGFVWGVCPGKLVALLGLTCVVALLSPAIAQVGKLVVDAAMSLRAESGGAALGRAALVTVVALVALEFVLYASMLVADRFISAVRHVIGNRVGTAASLQILEKSLTLSLRDFEQPHVNDILSRARRDASTRPAALVNRLANILRQGLTLAGYIVLLTAFSLWAVLALTLALLPMFFREAWLSREQYEIRRRRAATNRSLGYLEHVLTTDRFVKEVKIFGLGPELFRRYRDQAQGVLAEEEQMTRVRLVRGTPMALINTVAFYLCYALVIVAALRGRISVGEMTMYLLVFQMAQGSLMELVGALGGIYDDALYTSNLFEYLALPVARPAAALPVGIVRDERGIRFENVGFRYGQSESWAVRNLDFFLPEGRSLALLGSNGSGKSTVVRLLCGLDHPAEGRILLDGRDLRGWDQDELGRRLSVVLQDFNRYQLTVRENIRLGTLESKGDASAVERSASEAGLDGVTGRLPQGLDTQLGTWFEGGVELSGGEWQRVAIARALVRQGAPILVLDEPTAALDAPAAASFFQRLWTLARGRTVIVISHRCGHVRDADQIIVLEAGRIVEQGEHEELLRGPGAYRRLVMAETAGETPAPSRVAQI